MSHEQRKCIQNNAYFAHPENMLWQCSPMTGNIRQPAIRRILKARRKNDRESVQLFEIPKINFSAKEFVDLIEWQFMDVTEPPVTMHLSEEDLNRILVDGVSDILAEGVLGKLPTHTQVVERAVKEVTRSALQVCDEKKRDEIIRTRLFDRTIRPKFDSKKEFKA